MPPYDKRTPLERFWSMVRKSDDGCWEWTASGNGVGYGYFYPSGKHDRVYAHRYSVLLSGRNIPLGMQVMHICDNRACVRPDHLVVATAKENMRDAWDKGRNPGNRYGKRTHCKNGHPFNDSLPRRKDGSRRCRKCASERMARKAAAKKRGDVFDTLRGRAA